MRIIIIDDNKTVLLVYEIQLKKEGYVKDKDEFITYVNIADFRKENENSLELIDVIICDYDLGDKLTNGLKFFKDIKSAGYEGKCILLTGDDSFTMKTKMQLIKNIHYVIKNCDNPNKTTSSQLGEIIKNYRNDKYC